MSKRTNGSDIHQFFEQTKKTRSSKLTEVIHVSAQMIEVYSPSHEGIFLDIIRIAAPVL